MTSLSSLILAMVLLAPLGMAQIKYVNDVLSLNPVGYWRLNGSASDATANGNNGTLMNGVTFTGPGIGPPVGDPNNQAAVFNSAQDQYISMPTTASGSLFNLDWYHPFTMMIWAKTSNTANNMVLLAKEENSGNYRGPLIIVDNGDSPSAPKGAGRFLFAIQATVSTGAANSGNFLVVETLASIVDGNWHFLVATYDGTGQAGGVHLYVDGVAAATTVFANTLNGLTTLNNVPVTIGSRDTGGVSYSGLLAEAAIFGTALPGVQVRQLANDAGKTNSELFPFFADGKLAADTWQTEFLLINTGPTTVTANLVFHFQAPAQSAQTLPVSGLGAVVQISNIVLSPNGSAVYRTEGSSSSQIAIGWVEIDSSVPISGQALFRRHAGDGNYYEGSVALVSPPSMTFSLPFDGSPYSNGASFSTGIAVANPNSTASTLVTCTAYDTNGTILGSNLQIGPLTGFGHTISSLQSTFAAVLGVNRGILSCNSTQPVGVLGLRFFGPFALSSVPVATGN